MSTAQLLQELIDKKDNFELIRDQIAFLLKCEVENQVQLATTAGEDPNLWDMRIFLERTNPWDDLHHDPAEATREVKLPIVNVWYERSDFDAGASNYTYKQNASGKYNIDCYARGTSASTDSGHDAGDKMAALEVQRTLRLVRNIIMAGMNTNLQLRGNVFSRFINSVESLRVDSEKPNADKIHAGRISLVVGFDELSPQYEGQPLEIISLCVIDKNSEVLFEADFDHTT